MTATHWNIPRFRFARIRTQRLQYLNAVLGKKRPCSQTDTPTANITAALRVCLALREFRDVPGFMDDVAALLGWEPGNVAALVGRLVEGREGYLARRKRGGGGVGNGGGGGGGGGTVVALLVDQ